MALSLNSLKEKKLTSQQQKLRLPRQEDMVMPWQDMKAESTQCQNESGAGHTADEFVGRQTEDKLETNLRQTKDKPKTNLGQDIGQTEDKLETDVRHLNEKLRTKLRTEPKTILRQTEDKLETNVCSFAMLVGVQRAITSLLFDVSKWSRERHTHPVAIEWVADSVKTTVGVARKSIQRLENKGVLKRLQFKVGRGGWTKYELSQGIFGEMLLRETRDKPETSLRQTEDKLGTQLGTQLRTSSASSSSLLENHNFSPTTTAEQNSYNSWEIEDLDFSILEAIGFGRSQARQLQSLGINYNTVQNSIINFEFELTKTHSGKTMRAPLALFMKRMRENGVWGMPDELKKRRDYFNKALLEGETEYSTRSLTGISDGDTLPCLPIED